MVSLENPRRTGYFSDYVGNSEAGRYRNNRRHKELEQVLNFDTLQRYPKKNYNWNMDNVDSIAMLGQEHSEPHIPVEEVAEECDHQSVYTADCHCPLPNELAKTGVSSNENKRPLNASGNNKTPATSAVTMPTTPIELGKVWNQL